MNILWLWSVFDGFDFVLHDLDSAVTDDVSTEFDRWFSEDAFVRFGIEFVGSQDVEDLTKMFEMIIESIGVDDDIVEIYDEEDVEEVTKDIVNESLESCGSIG